MQWERMVEIAEFIAEKAVGDDFIRVDFYLSNGKIYLGELTFTPEGGRAKFEPRQVDIDLFSQRN
jgi:glutathione synthase/RimK-type ligase-like ATP-grasp enzyme